MKLTIYFSNRIPGETVHYDTCLLIRGAIRTTLLSEHCRGAHEVSVTFCNDEQIRTMNREYRGVDRATDVLSFPLQGESPDGVQDTADTVSLGDIVISLEHARRQAAEFGHSEERELAFLAAHSTLHLLGYDHERSEAEDLDMRDRQRKVMERMGLSVK